MPRKPTIRTDICPYHITSRANNREWFDLPLSEVWELMIPVLEKGIHIHEIKLHAFVLMANHYHLLLRTPKSNIDHFMQFFNKNFGQEIARATGRINRIFGAPYKWSLISEGKYYANVYRYIYQNPMRAGASNCVEEYPYSSLTGGNLHRLIDREDIFIEKKIETSWINQKMDKEKIIAIKLGLKKYEFSPGKSGENWKRKVEI